MDDFITSAVLLTGFLLLLYVVLIRPQLRKLRQQEKFLSELHIGSEVVTSGGVIGKITDFQGEKVAIIESVKGVSLRILKSNIDYKYENNRKA